MTDTPPDASWWQATDGKWYSPEQHPNYVPPQLAKTTAKWVVPAIVLGFLAVLVVSFLGMVVERSSSSDPDEPTTTLTTRTPRPTATQSARIESGVAAVYPGVPEGKATDWAVSTCLDIRQGKTENQLINNVGQRYAGGSRPDPTPAQARAILDVIREADFCV